MKPLKIIIPIVVVLFLAAIGFWIWKGTDHREEFAGALYAGDLAEVESMLKAHPSLVKTRHIENWATNMRMPLSVDNWTPLHVAVVMGNAEMVKLLARYHADLNARDKRGLTPLLWTTFSGRHAAAEALISAGADINARGLDGRSALDLAKLQLDNELMDILRRHGAKE